MASLSGWTSGILLSILFVAMLGLVVGNMNHLYDQDYDVGLGTNTTLTQLQAYQDTGQSQIEGGDVGFDAEQGITLSSSFGMAKQIGSIVWGFITGGWIETITTDFMKLPEIVGKIFRILYFISVILIFAYLFFKVRP